MSERDRPGTTMLRLAVAVCLAALGLQTAACRSRQPEEAPVDAGAETVPISEDPASLELYFPTANDRLQRESREIAPADDAAGRIRLLVESLLAGPTTDGLFAPLPAEVSLAAVQISPGGIAYLDFESPAGSEPPPSGTRAEIVTIYSIVDSVVLNIAEVHAVVLLWNGRQRFSFAGHLDTSAPLTPDLNLIVGGS